MDSGRKLPIGIRTFREIREEDPQRIRRDPPRTGPGGGVRIG